VGNPQVVLWDLKYCMCCTVKYGSCSEAIVDYSVQQADQIIQLGLCIYNVGFRTENSGSDEM